MMMTMTRRPAAIMDEFFRMPFLDDMLASSRQNMSMRVDVKEEPDSYTLFAEMPGVKQEDINLTVENDMLTLAADVNMHKKDEQEHMVYQERRSGHMERSFSLEGIDQGNIKASYENGILTIELPKEKLGCRSQRRIAISAAETEKTEKQSEQEETVKA